MNLKLKKILNESLLEEYITINIPIKVKFRTDSSQEEDLLKDLKSLLNEEVTDNVEYYSDKDIYPYLKGMEDKIAEELNISTLEIEHIYVNLDSYHNIPMMNGTLFFDIFTKIPVEEGLVKKTFNTLLNNNIINKEFTITLEDDIYDIFDVIIEVEKLSDVEIGAD